MKSYDVLTLKRLSAVLLSLSKKGEGGQHKSKNAYGG